MPIIEEYVYSLLYTIYYSYRLTKDRYKGLPSEVLTTTIKSRQSTYLKANTGTNGSSLSNIQGFLNVLSPLHSSTPPHFTPPRDGTGQREKVNGNLQKSFSIESGSLQDRLIAAPCGSRCPSTLNLRTFTTNIRPMFVCGCKIWHRVKEAKRL